VAADDLVVIGLSLSSSWGNGHATTYRALLGGLASIGQRVLFLERDVPWYAGNRDLRDPDFCELAFYTSTEDLRQRFQPRIARAGSVIIGSYVPDGIAAIEHHDDRDGERHHGLERDEGHHSSFDPGPAAANVPPATAHMPPPAFHPAPPQVAQRPPPQAAANARVSDRPGSRQNPHP
jgi:hypothetical protein